jgi:hypothetical protein
MSLNLKEMQAVYSLYSSVVSIRNDVALDADENIVEYDLAAVQAEAESMEAAKQATHDAANAKLKKLGLTDDEISALKGTL